MESMLRKGLSLHSGLASIAAAPAGVGRFAEDALASTSSATRFVTNPMKMKKSISAYIVGVQEEKAMAAVPTTPIEASRFLQYVQERKKKKILFKGELLMVKKTIEDGVEGLEPMETEKAQSKENVEKNQYPDTLPYDFNRVILNLLPGDAHSDYINASYVDSFTTPQFYVVTQSLKTKPACVDFWRLVWESESNCIVMLTKVFDYMRVMCLQYWPLTKFLYGDIEVETLETKTYAHFVIRTLKLTHRGGGAPRLVEHFHFIEWELDSFPYISAFLELRRRVREHLKRNPPQGPMIVHCSNGGLRSGTFLAVDANLELLEKENTVDIFGFCKILHYSRMHLIETVEQYQFIYDVLAEAITCKVEPIQLIELMNRSSQYKTKKGRDNFDTKESHEYKQLCALTPPIRIGDCAGGHRLENRGKNRDVMVVPHNARPYLQTLHGESKDYTYINAVYVDGYTRKSEWITTEWPKHHTVDSLWALIFDHNVHTIVNLSNQGNSKTYPTFIHQKGKQVYGPFMVEVLNYQVYDSMTSHMVKVMKRTLLDKQRTIGSSKKSPKETITEDEMENSNIKKETFMISEIMASSGNAIQEAETRICCIISFSMWPLENKVPLSTSGLVDVIKMARSWRKRAPDKADTKPAIVLSHNGKSRVGIYIAANVCIDQMDMDGEIDVFHAVKMIRINRPQLVDTKDEYKYLYDLMLTWYMSNPEYRTGLPQSVVNEYLNENRD